MRFIVAFLLIATFLGGCAETMPVETAAPDAVDEGNQTVETDVNETLEQFTLVVEIPSDVIAGTPFNVTIDSTLPAEAAANATWSIDSNGTLAEGIGVPTIASLNLTEGNHTLHIRVLADGYGPATSSADVSIAPAVAGFDAPPAPLVFEGSGSGTGLAGLGFCDTADKTFTFDNPLRLHAMTFKMAADDSDTGGDFDWTIKGPGGENHFSDAIGNEAPKRFDLPGQGAWSVTVHCYAAWMDVDYTITVEFE